jgi:hypothetical protein
VQKSEARSVSGARAVFREVNKRIRDLPGAARFDGPALFLCECDDRACDATVELTLEEFEAIRWRENVYIVSVGHERPDAERIIEKTPRFVLVEKVARAATRP